MVKKTIKKTPTKSIKRCIHRKRSSPAKASVVITALHDSFFTCRRRLAKLFSKLSRISTSTPSKKRKGFRKIKPLAQDEQDQIPPSPSPSTAISAQKALFWGLLPPLDPDNRRTVFLDLDETLIHSSPDPPPQRYDFVVRPVIDGEALNFYVLKRPGVDELLDFLSTRFEIVVFTAGLKEYASLVLDQLDRNRVISHRLYRDSCKEMDGRFVKDLSQMGRDLKRVLIVDDNPSSYALQPDNALQIRPFVDDLEDKEVWQLMDFFDGCERFDDLREAIRVFAPFGWQNVECCGYWLNVDLDEKISFSNVYKNTSSGIV